MEIQRKETEDKGEFFIEENDRQIASLTYKKSGDGVITIDHTEVDSNFRGKNIGEDLVAEAVKFARENNLKIVPTCQFAKKVIDDKPEFQDVLAN
jgi:predicted GNAT family acetyltransferase